MAKETFEHNGEKYTVKGEWDGNTFTAQAFLGRKKASDPFEIKRPKGKDVAPDDVLEQTVFNAAKNDVIHGDGVSEAKA